GAWAIAPARASCLDALAAPVSDAAGLRTPAPAANAPRAPGEPEQVATGGAQGGCGDEPRQRAGVRQDGHEDDQRYPAPVEAKASHLSLPRIASIIPLRRRHATRQAASLRAQEQRRVSGRRVQLLDETTDHRR